MDQFEFSPVDKEEFAKGKLVKGIEVFKTGTYRGKKYTHKDLQEMIDNFKKLKETSDFDPPVRIGHRIDGRSDINAQNIIGYVNGLSAEEDDKGVTHLYADTEITDKNGLEKIKSGTLKKRSVEIGGYENNQGQVYGKNVFWGFGFVDVPQVEKMAEVKVYDKSLDRELYDIEIDVYADPNGKKVQSAIDAVKKILDEALKSDDYYRVQSAASILQSLKWLLPSKEIDMDKEEEAKLDAELAKGDDKYKTCVAGKMKGGMGKADAMKACQGMMEVEKAEEEKEAEEEKKAEELAKTGELVTLSKEEHGVLLDAKNRIEQLEKEQLDKKMADREAEVNAFHKEAKVLTANLDKEIEFPKGLSDEQYAAYSEIKKAQPGFVQLDAEKGTNESGKPEEKAEENKEKEAVKLANEAVASNLREKGWSEEAIEKHLASIDKE
jgi:hypothetical protein